MGKLKQYSMSDRVKLADEGAKIIESFLTQNPKTVAVINVEKEKRYQIEDIDFIWVYKQGEAPTQHLTLELKVDQYKTGNFFFETHSNLNKNTPGCFMYTKADFLFYYFINQETLYILPTELVRHWFKENIHRFEEKRLATQTNQGKVLYQSAGRLVPIQTLLNELGHQIVIHSVSFSRYQNELHNQ